MNSDITDSQGGELLIGGQNTYVDKVMLLENKKTKDFHHKMFENVI